MRAVVVAVASVIVMGFLSVPAVAHADACVSGTVKRGGSGGDYFLCQGDAWLQMSCRRSTEQCRRLWP